MQILASYLKNSVVILESYIRLQVEYTGYRRVYLEDFNIERQVTNYNKVNTNGTDYLVIDIEWSRVSKVLPKEIKRQITRSKGNWVELTDYIKIEEIK